MGEHTKLLVLCCHGVYHKEEFYSDRPAEKEVYQNHIRLAFDTVREKTYDVLIISGGYTKREVEKSEAQGYLEWADAMGLDRAELIILLEEYARSSAENLMFSMCRFYQKFNYFPEKVGSCTLSWKRKWHTEVISLALDLPEFTVETVGDEEEKLKEIQAKFPTERVFCPNSRKIAEITEKESRDPLELLKNIADRDFWKKGHPYANINLGFAKMFDKLEEMRKQGNVNADDLKPFYPWKQKA